METKRESDPLNILDNGIIIFTPEECSKIKVLSNIINMSKASSSQESSQLLESTSSTSYKVNKNYQPSEAMMDIEDNDDILIIDLDNDPTTLKDDTNHLLPEKSDEFVVVLKTEEVNSSINNERINILHTTQVNLNASEINNLLIQPETVSSEALSKRDNGSVKQLSSEDLLSRGLTRSKVNKSKTFRCYGKKNIIEKFEDNETCDIVDLTDNSGSKDKESDDETVMDNMKGTECLSVIGKIRKNMKDCKRKREEMTSLEGSPEDQPIKYSSSSEESLLDTMSRPEVKRKYYKRKNERIKSLERSAETEKSESKPTISSPSDDETTLSVKGKKPEEKTFLEAPAETNGKDQYSNVTSDAKSEHIDPVSVKRKLKGSKTTLQSLEGSCEGKEADRGKNKDHLEHCSSSDDEILLGIMNKPKSISMKGESCKAEETKALAGSSETNNQDQLEPNTSTNYDKIVNKSKSKRQDNLSVKDKIRNNMKDCKRKREEMTSLEDPLLEPSSSSEESLLDTKSRPEVKRKYYRRKNERITSLERFADPEISKQQKTETIQSKPSSPSDDETNLSVKGKKPEEKTSLEGPAETNENEQDSNVTSDAKSEHNNPLSVKRKLKGSKTTLGSLDGSCESTETDERKNKDHLEHFSSSDDETLLAIMKKPKSISMKREGCKDEETIKTKSKRQENLSVKDKIRNNMKDCKRKLEETKVQEQDPLTNYPSSSDDDEPLLDIMNKRKSKRQESLSDISKTRNNMESRKRKLPLEESSATQKRSKRKKKDDADNQTIEESDSLPNIVTIKEETKAMDDSTERERLLEGDLMATESEQGLQSDAAIESNVPVKKRGRGRPPKKSKIALDNVVELKVEGLESDAQSRVENESFRSPMTVAIKRRGRRSKNGSSIEYTLKINEDGTVSCAVCNKNIQHDEWIDHKENVHYGLAWRIGEVPLVSPQIDV